LTGEVWESTVAVTSTVPVPGGEVAVQVVFEEQETSVAGLAAPKSITVAPDVLENPVPEIETTVPPEINPVAGDRPRTEGEATVDR
jgi:hypothetical protein